MYAIEKKPIIPGGPKSSSHSLWSSYSKSKKELDSQRRDSDSMYEGTSSLDDSSRRSSKLSFMKTLLTNEYEDINTSDSGINSLKTTTTTSKHKRSKQQKPAKIEIDTNEKLDILVLLGNEKNVDKIETLTNKEYDLCNFRTEGYIPKISVLNPRIYYLNIDHDQVELEKRKKFNYKVRETDSVYVDPFDRKDDKPARPWRPKRSSSIHKSVFRCVSRANPRNNLKNRDRTKSIHEHIKESTFTDEEHQRSFGEEVKLSKKELLESAQRLSRRRPNTVQETYEWNNKKSKKMDPKELEKSALRLSRRKPTKAKEPTEWEKMKLMSKRMMSPEEMAKSAQRLSRRRPVSAVSAAMNETKKETKRMDPTEMERSVLRLSRIPKRAPEPENYKTLHDGKLLTEEEVEKMAQRLSNSRS